MGGLFNREYVTGLFIGNDVTIAVTLVNPGPTDTTVAVTTGPGQYTGDGVNLPPLTTQAFPLQLTGGKGDPALGWVRILTQTDRVIPTVTITSDGSSQTYLPGDLMVFDLISGARLW